MTRRESRAQHARVWLCLISRGLMGMEVAQAEVDLPVDQENRYGWWTGVCGTAEAALGCRSGYGASTSSRSATGRVC
jgi:hypothetical protein